MDNYVNIYVYKYIFICLRQHRYIDKTTANLEEVQEQGIFAVIDYVSLYVLSEAEPRKYEEGCNHTSENDHSTSILLTDLRRHFFFEFLCHLFVDVAMKSISLYTYYSSVVCLVFQSHCSFFVYEVNMLVGFAFTINMYSLLFICK